jgi:hypothetical protein
MKVRYAILTKRNRIQVLVKPTAKQLQKRGKRGWHFFRTIDSQPEALGSVEALISQAAGEYLSQAADEYLQRLALGEQPQVEEYATRYYPQVAVTLGQVLPALELLRQRARQLLAGGSTPSPRPDQEELAQRVRRAMSQLPEMEREVLLMRTVDEFSFEEAAFMLNIDPAAALTYHGWALLRLAILATDNCEDYKQR